MIIKNQVELIKIVYRAKKRGQKLAVCNGAFDLLHAGHIYLFKQAKELSDIVIVLTNSDNSIKRYKGNNRPILNQENRTNLLDSIKFIDFVFVFNEESPIRILNLIKPDFYIAGPDYAPYPIEKPTIEKYGGKLIFAKRDKKASSTTQIINKIIKSCGGEKTKAVFLDRDGVINVDTGYVGKIKDFIFTDQAPEAIADLYRHDYKIFVISNQSGVARKYFSKEDVDELTIYMKSEIEKAGGKIEEVCYCFCLPDDSCKCRKPNPTNLQKIINKYNVVTKDSYFISDTKDDISMANKLDIKTIWINTNPDSPKNQSKSKADFDASSLKKAADIILSQN